LHLANIAAMALNQWIEGHALTEQKMAEGLQIDNDWKKQAQEEKRKLAEQEAQRKSVEPAGVAPITPMPGAMPDPRSAASSGASARAGGAGASRELPQASFATLVQSVVTQALFHLGELAVRGGEPVVNLDMAKHQIDTLGVLEEKTANNLTPEEKRLLDSALYETRMRYVSVASQYIS
jgi:hypothetical protein